jgi:hypothetical protein
MTHAREFSASMRRPMQRLGQQGRRFMLILAIWSAVALAACGTTKEDPTLGIIRQEIAQLPPYPGSTVTGTDVYESPDRPDIALYYTLPGTCADLQDHYQQVAPAAGWTMDGPVQRIQRSLDDDPRYVVLVSTYHKRTQSLPLELAVDCFVDQQFSSGYYFTLRALTM